MSSAASPLPFTNRLRRFRVDVGTVIAAVVLTQSLLLVAMGYWGSQRLVSAVGESAHRADHLRVEDKVNAFLARSASAVQAMAHAPRLDVAGGTATSTTELLWVLLQQSPELDSLYAADDRGRMLMVLRYPEPAIRQIVREAGATTETWAYKAPFLPDADPQQSYATRRSVIVASSYDPLARTWYRQARAAQRPVWTQPYVFAAVQELGVTYAMSVQHRDRGGEVRPMVLAGDVTLGRLSDFVREFSSPGYGDAALISADGQVLARSDRSARIRRLATAEDGVLGMVQARLDAGQPAPKALTLEDGRRYLVDTSQIHATGWRLVSWVPEDRLLGGLRHNLLWSLALILLFLLLVLVGSLKMARRVTAPVEALSTIARRIGRLELDGLPRVQSRVLELQQLDHALAESARGLQAFRKFVPIEVLRQLVNEGQALRPNGTSRRITVMFTDIEGFTRIAEHTSTDLLVTQLTHYFNLATEIVTRHGGTIDKYIGDGMMILWGAPTHLPDAELQACRAALELQARLDVLNAEWRGRGVAEFKTRIGIHTGMATIGAMGSNDRLAYTALGDTVNVASRIETANKALGTRVLMSECTCVALQGRLPTRPMDTMTLRGRSTPLRLHELLEPDRDGAPASRPL